MRYIPKNVEGIVFLSIALTASMISGGCSQALLTAGATAGVAISQERSFGDAIDDATIALSIRDKLFMKSDELFLRVTVKSVEGRVLLMGNVNQPEERVEVARIAWQATGVREVYNELEVRDRTSLVNYFNDVRISNDLRFRLLREKNISAINFTVETVNQTVYLMGIAQDKKELALVTEQARNIKGVKKVLSYIILKNDARRTGEKQ